MHFRLWSFHLYLQNYRNPDLETQSLWYIVLVSQSSFGCKWIGHETAVGVLWQMNSVFWRSVRDNHIQKSWSLRAELDVCFVITAAGEIRQWGNQSRIYWQKSHSKCNYVTICRCLNFTTFSLHFSTCCMLVVWIFLLATNIGLIISISFYTKRSFYDGGRSNTYLDIL